ncbi:MAG TPA: alpha-E domain-containing protein, partial [Gammaproteobacteria bacterium]|nr:alpha-E domain-containing protein [Gammaproteobacteria bacterium]
SLTQLTQQLTARGDPRSDGTLDLLLELADSTMTYLGRYHAEAQLARVLDLLLVDETNPRSVAFQIASIEGHLAQLQRASGDGLLGPDMRITTELLSRVRLADVVELSDSVSRFGTRIQLDRLCRDTEKGVDTLSDYVTRQYFSHSAPRRVLSVDRRREPR